MLCTEIEGMELKNGTEGTATTLGDVSSPSTQSGESLGFVARDMTHVHVYTCTLHMYMIIRSYGRERFGDTLNWKKFSVEEPNLQKFKK